MPNNKAIGDFTQTTTESATDKYLIQRGNDYFYIEKSDIGGGFYKTRVVLTAAQLEDALTTPVELIAAQGANTYIDILVAEIFRNGTAFTAPDPLAKLIFTGETQSYFASSATFLTDVMATKVEKMVVVNAGNRLFANTGITFYLTQDVTTATGTVTIDIIYRVASFS